MSCPSSDVEALEQLDLSWLRVARRHVPIDTLPPLAVVAGSYLTWVINAPSLPAGYPSDPRVPESPDVSNLRFEGFLAAARRSTNHPHSPFATMFGLLGRRPMLRTHRAGNFLCSQSEYLPPLCLLQASDHA